VYIIGSESGPIKIGISDKPEKRVKQLQTGNPNKLSLIHTEEIEDNLAESIELEIHKNLKLKKTVGEWFNISITEAKLEIDFAIIKNIERLKNVRNRF